MDMWRKFVQNLSADVEKYFRVGIKSPLIGRCILFFRSGSDGRVIMGDMLYVVSDPLLFGPVRTHLRSLRWVNVVMLEGVNTFSNADITFVLIDPSNYNIEDVVTTLKRESKNKSRIHALAPSIIQYFIPKLDEKHDMYNVINMLANHPVYVENPAVMRMASRGPSGVDAIRYRVSFSSIPSNDDASPSGYVKSDGRLRCLKDFAFAITQPGVVVREVARPIVFQHKGLGMLGENAFMATICDDNSGDAEKKALALLAAIFPSKVVSDPLVRKIVEAFSRTALADLDFEAVKAACAINRKQWEIVRQKLEMFGIKVPETPDDDASPTANDHSILHLVSSNFYDFSQSLNIDLPPIWFVGLPVLARDGLTMTFGIRPDNTYGIMGSDLNVGNISQDVISHALNAMWPNLTAMKIAAMENA
jgi:hypothetical protein